MLKKKTVVPAEWDVHLPTVVYAYNACPHEATGESPHFLLFPRAPSIHHKSYLESTFQPVRWTTITIKPSFYRGSWECIIFNLEEYRKKMKEQYDRRFRTHTAALIKKGDRVYVKIPSEKGKVFQPKLTTDWSGPYRVIESSANSIVVTLIGQNKEPVRVQWDRLIKIPSVIDDTLLGTKGFRTRYSRRNKSASNHCNMIRKVYFQRVFDHKNEPATR
uniref:Integrase catalytic domain-containing protein n=1 Tax=Haemonchus placei TaxID=6290 RepID=A0A0N4W6U3_HAEPC